MGQNDPAYAGGRPSGYGRRWPKWVVIYAVAATVIYLNRVLRLLPPQRELRWWNEWWRRRRRVCRGPASGLPRPPAHHQAGPGLTGLPLRSGRPTSGRRVLWPRNSISARAGAATDLAGARIAGRRVLPSRGHPGRLKARLRPMRGLKRDRTARVIVAAHAFVQNLRRGFYDLGTEVPPSLRLADAFAELALAI